MINTFNKHITITSLAVTTSEVWIEPSTPKDWLSPEPTNSPPKKKPHTCQQITMMEGGNEDMEGDINTQQNDESIKMESD
jgi:hypothetical protein